MRLAIVLMALTLEVGSPAFAAQLRGLARWPAGSRIVVWVDPSGAPRGADALVTRALDAWSAAASPHLIFNRGTRDTAKLRIHFATAPGVYGETRPDIDPGTGLIRRAEVVIATGVAGDDPLNQRIVLYLTALHELGHAIGMRHTDTFADIMYSFRRPDDGERYFGAYRRRLNAVDDIGSEKATGLSADDIAAVRQLYR